MIYKDNETHIEFVVKLLRLLKKENSASDFLKIIDTVDESDDNMVTMPHSLSNGKIATMKYPKDS
jgi:Trp operon repressor